MKLFAHPTKPHFLFCLALDLKYLDLRRCEFAARAIDEIGRMAGGWMKACRVEKTPNTFELPALPGAQNGLDCPL